MCFVQDTRPNLDKLSPRSTRCMLVGYSRTQIGYRCYDPVSRKYLVSADVTFFENTPFFSSTSYPSLPIPLSVPTTESVYLPDHANKESVPITAPLQVYSRRPRQRVQPFTQGIDQPTSSDAGPVSLAPTTTPATSTEPKLPIALRKGTRSTAHPLSLFVAYDHLHPMYRTFALSLLSISIPRTYQEASQIPE